MVKILDSYRTNRLSDLALHASELASSIDVAEIVEDSHNRAVDDRDEGCPQCRERGCALDGRCINREDGQLIAECDEVRP